MKRLLFFFLAVFVLMAGCATKAEKAKVSAPKAKPTVNPIWTNKDYKPNECKICNFDYAAYKGVLSKSEIDALLFALNDEYLASAIYQGINEKFDNPRPFSNIVRAEDQHSKRLIDLFENYNMPVPKNPWLGNVPTYDSVISACEAAASAEIQNRQMYEQLLVNTGRKDIKAVYQALQTASDKNHLPAFERCASGGGGNGNGRGKRAQ